MCLCVGMSSYVYALEDSVILFQILVLVTELTPE